MSANQVYKVKSSARRAAKQEFGEDFESQVEFKEQDGGWVYDLKSKASNDDAKGSEAPAAIPAPSEAPKAPEASDAVAVVQAGNRKDDPVIEVTVRMVPQEKKDDAAEVTSQQKAADKQADAAVANVDPLKPRVSTIDLPTKQVWHIADDLYNAAEKQAKDNGKPVVYPKRKDVIAACVNQGIAYGTARTQFQHWFKCRTDCQAAPIATIGKDGKISTKENS